MRFYSAGVEADDDAVQAARFITQEQTDELAERIAGLAGGGEGI